MAKQTPTPGQQVILNNGIMQHLFTIPEQGLLVRLRVDGQRLSASFEQGTEQPGISLQILTWVLQQLQVDPHSGSRQPVPPVSSGADVQGGPSPCRTGIPCRKGVDMTYSGEEHEDDDAAVSRLLASLPPEYHAPALRVLGRERAERTAAVIKDWTDAGRQEAHRPQDQTSLRRVSDQNVI